MKSQGTMLLPFFIETFQPVEPSRPIEKQRPAKERRFTSSYEAEGTYKVWLAMVSAVPSGMEREPKKRRKEQNQQALKLLRKRNLSQDDREQIFNLYTGTGGLEDATAFSQNEASLGQYFTPPSIAEFVVNFLEVEERARVLEASCGHGVFLNYLPTQEVTANELKEETHAVAEALFPQHKIHNLDMQELTFLDGGFDYALGNPPFGLLFEDVPFHFDTRSEEGNLKSHLYALEQNIKLLKEGGFLSFVLPVSALEDFRAVKAQRFMKSHCVRIAEIYLPKETFAKANASIETVIVVLQKKTLSLERSFPTFTATVENLSWNSSGKWTGQEGDLPKVLEAWRVSQSYQMFRELKCQNTRSRLEEHFREKLVEHYRREVERKAGKFLYILQRLNPRKAASYEKSLEGTEHRFRLLERARFLLKVNYSRERYLTLVKGEYEIFLRPSAITTNIS